MAGFELDFVVENSPQHYIDHTVYQNYGNDFKISCKSWLWIKQSMWSQEIYSMMFNKNAVKSKEIISKTIIDFIPYTES